MLSAALVSMLLTFACACGQRTILPKSMPGRLMSNEYFARPETFCGPSMREIRLPMKFRLSASGHLYSAIAPPSFRRLRDRGANAHVGSAPAKVAAQSLLNFFGCRGWVLVQECLCRDHESRRAESTLLAVVINEGLLKRMKLVTLHQAFDCRDLFALRFDRENRTRVNRLAIDDHRASAASRAIAHALGAGDIEFVAQSFEQRHSRLDVHRGRLPIDHQLNWDFRWAIDPYFGAGHVDDSMSHHERDGQRDAGHLQEAAPR